MHFFGTGTCRMTGFCWTQCHREPSVFLEKTGTRHRLCNSSPILISLITINLLHSQASNFKKKWKNKLLCSESWETERLGTEPSYGHSGVLTFYKYLMAVVVIPSPVNMIMFQNSETHQNHLKSRSVLLHKMENEKSSGFPFLSWIYLM